MIAKGTLRSPYTKASIRFARGANSAVVQIDHLVALSDAWQKGAQQISATARKALANDPLNLLAVDGVSSQQKSNSDAASWLPKNKAYRCRYVARQISVKVKYRLWVTTAEKTAMKRVLSQCPNQRTYRSALKITVKTTSTSVTKSATGGAVSPDANGSCPKSASIKGNGNFMIYHLPSGRYYSVTKAEECFATTAAAQKAGYRASKA